MTGIRVVAAVIERDRKLLLGRRPVEKRHGGLWEFPGGKLDEGEGPAEAAGRELREELALDVAAVDERLFETRDPESPFVIEFYAVSSRGTPVALEHMEVGWFSVAELQLMPLAPADAAFVRWLAEGDSLGDGA